MIRPALLMAAAIVLLALFLDTYQAIHADLYDLREGDQP